ncbi:uncharacterized protein LOC134243761, partial [Saccostrea cucullata]|uniref:uncharacterized protein LOC134243761 n=1 Tax=Saccostrea cuccullata TaxID=36930 RepID=UPI002ECFCF5B
IETTTSIKTGDLSLREKGTSSSSSTYSSSCSLSEPGEDVESSILNSPPSSDDERNYPVYVNRQKISVKNLYDHLRVIDKDVPRTDRDLEYFNSPHRLTLIVNRGVGMYRMAYKLTRKYDAFIIDAMDGRPNTAIPGIGRVYGRRLREQGFVTALDVYGAYKEYDEINFKIWLFDMCRANRRYQNAAYQGLHAWSLYYV